MLMDFLTKILPSWPFLLILFAITSVGSYGFYKHATKHTDGTDDIQTAGPAQKGLMSSTHHSDLETAKSDITAVQADIIAIEADIVTLEADVLALEVDVAAIESEIIAARGSKASVDTRLSVCLADSGAISQGTSFPEEPEPIEGQVFYRTDEDKLYIYNGAAWDEVISPGKELGWTFPGEAYIGTGLGYYLVGPNLAKSSISKVKIYALAAPTGASLIVDVNKNGTTIFTTQANRPEIAISGNADDSGTPDVTTMAEGDRLSFDIDQVGSTIAGGSPLLITVVFT